MKIAVMGAGGLGGYVGGCLARAGNDVAFVARGARLAAMREKGLEVRSVAGTFHVPAVSATDDPADIGPVDLIVLGVKAYDVAAAAAEMRPLVGPDTLIVPVLNGVDHVETLNRSVGKEHVLGGLISMTAHVVSPGVVERLGEHGVFELGEQSGGVTDRVEAIERVLDVEGLNGKASPAVMAGMWQKFATICGVNVCCVVRGDKATVMRGMPETGVLMRRLCEEVVEVARALDVGLAGNAVDAAVALFESTPPHFKPSMLVGLERGDRLELEALNGAVVRYGRELGIDTPANDFAYACLKPFVNGVAS